MRKVLDAMQPIGYILWMQRRRYIVQQMRRQREMNQADLAQAAGISRKHLSEIERGRSRPSGDALLAIAEALRAEPRELMEEES